MKVLEPILDQISKLWARLDRTPVLRLGTVTVVAPLRVMLDGDDDHLPYSPIGSAAGLTVGMRVMCLEQNRRIYVLGPTQ